MQLCILIYMISHIRMSMYTWIFQIFYEFLPFFGLLGDFWHNFYTRMEDPGIHHSTQYMQGTIGCTPNSVPMVLIGLI